MMIQLFLAMVSEVIRINALLQIIAVSTSLTVKQLLQHHKHLVNSCSPEPALGPCKLCNSVNF